jgi:sugar O-acyltransferase (sialic acid O-acetyltransferase NeuD family)
MKTLYLCGAGNSEGVRLALRVNAAEARWDRIALLDDDPSKQGQALLGVEVVGPFDRLAVADPVTDSVVNLVARTTAGRRRAGEKIASYGVPFAGLVAPGVDTLGADLAPDVLVYPNATIGPEVVVGPGSVVFMGAVVGHESHVGSGCVMAANAVLNARVRLGDEVYVGANATLLPEVGVGAGATVGAGSAVIGDVDEGATVMGVPARVLVDASPPAPAPERPSAATIESVLTTAWTEVLEVADMDPTVHVFDLGATSLAALRVSDRIRRDAGLDLAVVDLFRFPTIRELAAHLAGPGPIPPPTARRPVAPVPAATPTAHEGDIEEAITHVFADVLGVPTVGPESHFFDLGGDTRTAQAACGALQKITGEPLCFMQVARYPTPRELARHLETTLGQPPTCPAQGVMNRLIHRHEWHRG